MEILPGVHLVDGIAMPGPGGKSKVNVGLLVEDDGITMVDAGPPGVLEALKGYLAGIGYGLSAVKKIIITHHHVDHTGALAEVVAHTGAQVMAHREDTGYIDGSKPRPVVEMPEERIRMFLPGATAEQVDEMRKRMKEFMRAQPVKVDVTLNGGEKLPMLGGCEIIHTPGHTPGHLCLYLPGRSLVISGDLMRYENKELSGPPPGFTEDFAEAMRSVRLIAQLSFEHMYGYHGEYLASDAGEMVRAFISRV